MLKDKTKIPTVLRAECPNIKNLFLLLALKINEIIVQTVKNEE